MSLHKSMTSEKGSIAVVWAIGGLLLVIGIFWVENFSAVLLDKYKDIGISNALSRAVVIENSESNRNLDLIVSAAGMSSDTKKYSFSNAKNISTIDDLDDLEDNDRLDELFRSKTTTINTVDVPFKGLNTSVGLGETSTLKTLDKSVKVFRPIHVILAVEATSDNRSLVNQVMSPFTNALQRLMDNASSSRISVIPYSYRVNSSGKCYTGISRSDRFSFLWWEDFFYQEDLLVTYSNQLNSAINQVANAHGSISSLKNQIASLEGQKGQYAPGSPEYNDIQAKIDQLNNSLRNVETSLPSLENNRDNAQKRYDDQKKLVERYKEDEQYKTYLPLAKHYAKRYDSYKYFEDYNDAFANSGEFSITEGDFTRAAGNVASSPESLNTVAVTRNKYFGDTTTCPSSAVSYDLSSASAAQSKLNGIDYSGPDLLSLEGLMFAGKTAFSRSSNLNRNVIFLFASDKDDVLEPDKLVGVNQICQTIKTSFISRRAAKLILVSPTRDAAEKFSKLSCATKWASDQGQIIIDELTGDVDQELEEKFAYYLSQESSTKNVNE